MPTLIVPLRDIITDPDHPVDLTRLPITEAVERIKDLYGFLSTAIDVEIHNGIATITLPEEKGYQVSQALANLERAAKSAGRGRYEAAIALYEGVLETLPAHTRARRDLAMALMEVGRSQEAKRHLIRVLQLDPKDAWAYLILGNLYLAAEQDLGSAERYYINAVDLAPDDPYIINALAALKGQRGDYAEAEALFLRAIELDPAVPNPRQGLALTYSQQGDLDRALTALEELFRQDASADPRHARVYTEARALYVEVRRRRALERRDAALERLQGVFDDYADQSGYGVRIQEEPELTTSAKVELAWAHGRDEHLIQYSDTQPAALPYLLAHEFEHIVLATEARAAGRNKHFTTAAEHVRAAKRVVDKDVQRILRRRGIEARIYQQYLDQIISGLANQLYNAPLDLVIDQRIHSKYPFLHDSQFVWMAGEQQTNLRALTDVNIRNMTPAKIYQANLAMNAASALFVDRLFGGATDFASRYRAAGHLGVGQRLYALYEAILPTFTPGDEYDLVDAYAKELKLTDWYAWQPDRAAPASAPDAPEMPNLSASPAASELAALLQEPAAQMAVTMYILGALKRFAALSREQVLQIAGEIALLGQTGIDYTSSDRQYTLRFVPGEQFTGLQLLALMYTGFRQVEPSLDTGIPLDAAYEQAERLYKLGM